MPFNKILMWFRRSLRPFLNPTFLSYYIITTCRFTHKFIFRLQNVQVRDGHRERRVQRTKEICFRTKEWMKVKGSILKWRENLLLQTPKWRKYNKRKLGRYTDHFLKREVFKKMSVVDYFIFNQIKCRFTDYVIVRKKKLFGIYRIVIWGITILRK